MNNLYDIFTFHGVGDSQAFRRTRVEAPDEDAAREEYLSRCKSFGVAPGTILRVKRVED